MEEKNNIDKLIQQYLNFYQEKNIEVVKNTANSFDDLMQQYKSKFTKDITDEQIPKQLNTNDNNQRKQAKLQEQLKNKQIQEAKQQEQFSKYFKQTQKKNSVQRKVEEKELERAKLKHKKHISGYGKWIIFALIILISGSYFYLTSDLSKNNTEDIYQGKKYSVNDYLKPYDDESIFKSENINTNLFALDHLEYIGDSSLADNVNVEIDKDKFLVINNKNPYHFYINYKVENITHSALISPYYSYYNPLYNIEDFKINGVGFYQFKYSLPDIGTNTVINKVMSLDSNYYNRSTVVEIMKCFYYKNSLSQRPENYIIIRQKNSTKGYYAFLDFVNNQIELYHSDNIDAYEKIPSDNKSDHNKDYITTISV